MENRLMEKNLTKEEYQDYLVKIVNIFRISDKRSSILYEIKIKDYQALAKLSIVNREGQREEFQDTLLDCDQDFSSFFLIPLIEKICEIVEVQTKDIVHLSSDNLVTFRIITNNNDLFTIDGLSPDDADALLSLSKQVHTNPPISISSNSDGTGNIFGLLFMIGLFMVGVIMMITLIR